MTPVNHYPIDSLVSAFGNIFPEHGIGRQYSDKASTNSLKKFLLEWRRHLDYEGKDYVLEGYHIQASTASSFQAQGFRVVALG